jgi:hypothetical protein
MLLASLRSHIGVMTPAIVTMAFFLVIMVAVFIIAVFVLFSINLGG